MYFHSKEQLEKMADNINKVYYPLRMENILPLDPYDLLEKLGLSVEWKYITPNDSILGMICFDDTQWFVWEKGNYCSGDKPHIETFNKGTIIINQVLLDSNNNYKKEIFVCTHEITHRIKDKAYFKNNAESMLQVCHKDSFEKTFRNSKMSEKDVIERQNNYLCAAVLMPRNVIKREFFRKLRFKNIPTAPIDYKPYMRKIIKEIADGYNINFNPVLYRLFDLQILKRE